MQFNGDGTVAASPAFTYATTTNTLAVPNVSIGAATTTTLFSTTASSTNLFAETASLGSLALTIALPVSSGGTGLSTPSAAGILLGSYAGGGWQQLATSSLGLLTTNVAEGSNLYFTNARVASYIDSSSTIPSVAGALGNVLSWNGASWAAVATSSLGISGGGGGTWGSITGTLANQSDLQSAFNTKLSLASWYATTTDALAQGTTNKYFSNALAQSAISVSGAPLTYSSGVVGINQANGSQPGYLSSSDWNTFNGKLASTSLSGSGVVSYNTGTGAIGTQPGTFGGSGAYTFPGDLIIGGNATTSGNIIPSATNTYSLGSPSYTWKDVYIGPGSLYVNGQEVVHTDASQNVVLTSNSNQNLELQTAGTGSVLLNSSGTGNIQLAGPVQITGGDAFTTSNGTPVLFTNGVEPGNLEIAANTIQATNTNGGVSISPSGNGGTYVTSGNVGIGTTNPGSKLEVQGTVAAQSFSATSTTATSTFADGINLSGGCFALGGNCLTLGNLSGTIANNQLANSSLTINGSPFALGSSGTITAASSTLLADNNTFSGTDNFTNSSSNFGGTWQTYSPSHFLDFASWYATTSAPQITSAANLATVGTITSGIWHGTALANTYGGTGQNSSGWTGLAGVSSGTWYPIATSSALNTSITGNAGTVTNGVYTTDTGTVTNTMLAGGIANAKLANATIKLNGTTLTLGDTADTITAASSTLLADNNTFTGLDTFTNATSTLFSATNAWIAYASTTAWSTTATSTGTYGINLSGGCFAINGTCVGGSSLTGTTGQLAYFSGTNAAVGTSTLFISTASNVGIGTTTPWAKLSVTGPDASISTPGFIVANSSNTPLLTVLDSGDIDIGTTTDNAFLSVQGYGSRQLFDVASSSGASFFHIAVTGNIGLASTTPWGNLSISSSNSPYPEFVVGSSTATSLLVSNTGYVGIGSTTPGSLFSVNGAANFVANATSTIYNGLNVVTGSTGCLSINSVCIGNIIQLLGVYATSSAGTTTIAYTGSASGNGGNGSSPSFSNGTLTLPSNIDHVVVQVWGGGGGGGNYTLFGAGGGQSSFAGYATSTGGGGNYNNVGGTGGIATTTGGFPSTFTLNGGGGGSSGSSGSSGGGTGGTAGNAGTGGAGGPVAGNGSNGGSPGGGGGGAGGDNACGGTGGGGGGAYAQITMTLSQLQSAWKSFTVGTGGAGDTGGGTGGCNGDNYNGGNGGNGEVVIYVYTYQSNGNDYAELYPVANPSITAGDIVSVDDTAPVQMRLAQQGDTTLAGVVSTNPGQVLGDQNAVGERPIALSGRVPVKVSLQNGPTNIGDRIAVSSTPGVGMKAGAFDDSVGIALESYDGTATSSQITVFIDLQKGIDLNDITLGLLGQSVFNDLTSSASSTASSTSATSTTPLDFVGGMMDAIGARITALTTLSNSSSTATTSAATSTDEYASSFLQAIFGQLVQWFASAANGIGDFFAAVGNFDQVNVANQLCVGTTCVTPAQFQAMVAAAIQSTTRGGTSSAGGSATASSSATSNATDSPPVIQINGDNPAMVQVGASYSDLGATITGPQADLNLGIATFVNGAPMNPVQIDTSAAATDTIDYVVTDSQGLTSTSTRTVIILPAQAAQPANDNQASTTPANDNEAATTTAAATSTSQ
ncbi:MAG: immunoglobulin-like domain-containing protein [Roseiarcus sp.]